LKQGTICRGKKGRSRDSEASKGLWKESHLVKGRGKGPGGKENLDRNALLKMITRHAGKRGFDRGEGIADGIRRQRRGNLGLPSWVKRNRWTSEPSRLKKGSAIFWGNWCKKQKNPSWQKQQKKKKKKKNPNETTTDQKTTRQNPDTFGWKKARARIRSGVLETHWEEIQAP